MISLAVSVSMVRASWGGVIGQVTLKLFLWPSLASDRVLTVSQGNLAYLQRALVGGRLLCLTLDPTYAF